ncbi:hypothetical protein ACLI09_07835 [Flavobacterium sp. RHBU_24]|uniref:hypothetical protein n=1 Tax=Flavobacterium sp. RHBU_24 TaxID=3391185 RepID=UPI003984E5B4
MCKFAPEMRKLLIKIFLPLFILLSGGYGKAHATAFDDCICISQSKIIDTPEHLNHCKVQTVPAQHVKYTQTDLEELNDRIDSTDSENEDDDVSSKKLVDVKKYLTSVFSLQNTEFIYQPLKKGLPQCKHFFYFTACRRYIIFRVIRI